jgi:hypothetical protein
MTPEARFLLNLATFLLTEGAFIGACIFAWLKGRSAERYGGSLYAVSAAATLAFQISTGQDIPMVPMLILDSVVAVGFLILAIRYNNLWLGAAMMIKGLQLALHATHLTDAEDPHWGGANVYRLSLSAISLFISCTIIGGTFASIRLRRRRPGARASLPTAPVI